MPVAFIHRLSVALFALLAFTAPVWAAAPTIAVAPGAAEAFDALAGAYDHAAPQRVQDGADLVLEPGAVPWRSLQAVAVTPGLRLRIAGDAEDPAVARAFLDFARSPDGQRALIDAGLLPEVVTVTDQAGRTVQVPQPVRGIASPYSLATYLVYVTGAGDRLLSAGYLGARDPEGAAAMARIDPRFEEVASAAPSDTTSVEFLATLAPDLVLASARSEWAESVATVGMPVLRFDGESPATLREAIALVGRVLGPDAAARAEAWGAYYDEVLARVAEAGGESEGRTRVLFTGTDRSQVASGAMYQTAWIEAAGGRSVSEALNGHWSEVGIEQVLLWDPELVLVPPYGRASVEAIEEDPSWALLDAVRAGRVMRVPKLVAPWDTPVPDSLLGVVWLAERLRPGAALPSCRDEAAFFYARFYDYEPSGAELEGLCGP